MQQNNSPKITLPQKTFYPSGSPTSLNFATSTPQSSNGVPLFGIGASASYILTDKSSPILVFGSSTEREGNSGYSETATRGRSWNASSRHVGTKKNPLIVKKESIFKNGSPTGSARSPTGDGICCSPPSEIPLDLIHANSELGPGSVTNMISSIRYNAANTGSAVIIRRTVSSMHKKFGEYDSEVKKDSAMTRNSATGGYQRFFSLKESNFGTNESGKGARSPTSTVTDEDLAGSIEARNHLRERNFHCYNGLEVLNGVGIVRAESASLLFQPAGNRSNSRENTGVDGGDMGQKKKKLFITKDKVRFINKSTQKSKSREDIVKLHKRASQIIRSSQTKHATRRSTMVKTSTSYSRSPGSEMRRQKSDNLLTGKGSLCININSKLEVPRVVKATMENINSSLMVGSPVNQVPSSYSILETGKKTALKHMSYQQDLLNRKRQISKKLKSPTKTDFNFQQSESHSKGRVSDALLLDNYLIKPGKNARNQPMNPQLLKGHSHPNPNPSPLSNLKPFSGATTAYNSKSSETIQSSKKVAQPGPFLTEDNDDNDNPFEFATKGDLKGPMTVDELQTSYRIRRNTLSEHITKLMDEHQLRAVSPIRVSEDLLDVDFLKKKASERIKDQRPLLSSQEQMHVNSKLQIQSSVSTNQLTSLQHANTTEKFKELIDNMFVPTANAFKKREKDKEFRRPTQNPVRRSKSGSGKTRGSDITMPVDSSAKATMMKRETRATASYIETAHNKNLQIDEMGRGHSRPNAPQMFDP